MAKRKEMVFTVRLTPPPGVTKADMRQFVENAVVSEVGYALPEDPVSDLNRADIHVSHAKEPEHD